MELSWSTFVLEIINFLVLVWILKRFLYKPVLAVIAERRAGIEKKLADAETLHADAQSLRERYETRVAEWNRERERAVEGLDKEIEAQRRRRLAELETSIEQERQKAALVEEHRQADAARRLEDKALAQSLQFATRLLEPLAGPEMHQRLVDLVVRELDDLGPERAKELRNDSTADTPISIASALPLPPEQQQRLTARLKTALALEGPVSFEVVADLLAGIRISVGAWVLGMSLRDELEGFARLARHDDSPGASHDDS